MSICIGLFGTCGGSKWREPFMTAYKELNINFFNPQVDDWKPEDAVFEAMHLANDDIILFPVTGETYGLGSLSEVGFSILQAIRLESRRDFIVYIEMELDEALKDNEALYKESMRSRKLIAAHLKEMNMSNVFFVTSLEQMQRISIALALSTTQRNLAIEELARAI